MQFPPSSESLSAETNLIQSLALVNGRRKIAVLLEQQGFLLKNPGSDFNLKILQNLSWEKQTLLH